eukprot:XP_025014633.1 uncharacterized protein LOC112536225 [Ricinus communis]
MVVPRGTLKRPASSGGLPRPPKLLKLGETSIPLVVSYKFIALVEEKYGKEALVSYPLIATDVMSAIQLSKDQELFVEYISNAKITGFVYGHLALDKVKSDRAKAKANLESKNKADLESC